jgi:uncharacterized membrane-anchored protein YhcB (DUF1043 family)
MKDWQDLLTTLGITSIWLIVILIIVGFISKIAIEKFFDSRLEKAKNELETKLESYKAALERIKKENEIKFNRLHTERANALKELWTKLRLYKNSTFVLLDMLESNDDRRQEQMKFLVDNYVNFVSTYEDNLILFSPETCEVIDEFHAQKELIDQKIYDYLNNEEIIELKNNNEEERKKYLVVLQEVRKEAESTIIPILKRVIADFREIMGVI